jgi:hypothetical protein
MPTETPPLPRRSRLAVLAALAALAPAAHAQTDDTTPFYAGGTLGVTHVSNLYRESSEPNSDTVVSTGLLAGTDQRLGRQHLTLDGSLQNNRYSTNSTLNYSSHSLRGALNWETLGNLSGVLSLKSEQSMADFNVSGVEQIFKKNIETNDEAQALVRLGLATRYSLEAGWTHRRRDFSAEEYDRLVYRQNTGSLGLYMTPGSNVRLGLVGRHTKGTNPRFPDGTVLTSNDYTRDDVDFTTTWTVGGHSSLNTRISRSRSGNSLASLSSFRGTTGAAGWTWQPSSKLQLSLQYSRDTGQETTIRTGDLNRLYASWQVGGSYALTGKVSLSARATGGSARSTGDGTTVVNETPDRTKGYNVGLRWAFSRGFSLGCQYDHFERDSNTSSLSYTANSYGCTGQLLFF